MTATVSAVECAKCGRLHRLDAETFIRFRGELYLGMVRQLLRPADEEIIYCVPCFHHVIVNLTPRVTPSTVTTVGAPASTEDLTASAR